jgi:hypothetical protein
MKVAISDRLTAIDDSNYGDADRWKPHDNQSRQRVLDRCLAAIIFKYNKATVLNNCVCVDVSFEMSAARYQHDARKPMYRAGNNKHATASKALS